jgi:hypothetical protein
MFSSRREFILSEVDGVIYFEKAYRTNRKDRRARARIAKRKAERAAMREAMADLIDDAALQAEIAADQEDWFSDEYDEYREQEYWDAIELERDEIYQREMYNDEWDWRYDLMD